MISDEFLLKSLIEVFEKYDSWTYKSNESEIEGLTYAEVHTLDYIGSMEGTNVTKFAEYMNMTKGAISKISKKLIDKKLIESYKKCGNKKELYFKLTNEGQGIYCKHKKLHEKAIERDKKLFSYLKDEEREIINEFLEKIKLDFNNKLKDLSGD